MTFHPLDPLTAEEFRTAAGVLALDRGVGAGWRIASIELVDPGRAAIAAFDDDGTVPERHARLVVFNRADNSTYVSVVSLGERSVLEFTLVPDVQANFVGSPGTELEFAL